MYFQIINLVDLFTILPYIVSVFINQLADLKILSKAGQMVRMVRMIVRDIKILRILKLLRYFVGLQSLLSTLKQVCNRFIILNLLFILPTVYFSLGIQRVRLCSHVDLCCCHDFCGSSFLCRKRFKWCRVDICRQLFLVGPHDIDNR